ncbi:hypothetical protein ABZ943_10065 [Streptomyces rubiginosohelvolus]|uniref:hypothetical protein n=1 Tax=Streptomyces rubiginosohelvolus TaxID=67362 RepID=UPI0033FFB859
MEITRDAIAFPQAVELLDDRSRHFAHHMPAVQAHRRHHVLLTVEVLLHDLVFGAVVLAAAAVISQPSFRSWRMISAMSVPGRMWSGGDRN